jgi:transcriptional regulator of arginine metabolism
MPKTTTNDRAKRRQRLLELLREGFVGSQEEIVERLAKDGFKATQATISRDLDDIGAVRRHDNGHAVYGLSPRNGPPDGFGRRVFAEVVISIDVSLNLVVLRTFPGAAPTVAGVLDSAAIDGIIGTVAGDDTVLVVADEKTGGKKVAKQIELIGADG